jgi:hypothetical protein
MIVARAVPAGIKIKTEKANKKTTIFGWDRE